MPKKAKIAEIAVSEVGVGNNELPPQKVSKQPSQISHYCFTHNNYTNVDNLDEIERKESKLIAIKKMTQLLNLISKAYVFQSEIGECGTLHLQGFVMLEKPMRITELNTHFKCVLGHVHWEKRKGSVKSCIAYCTKQETKDMDLKDMYFNKSIQVPTKLNIITKLKPWQKSLDDICLEIPDDRTIIWVFDPVGNNGKTCFCKYMYNTHNALLCTGGKISDISCMLSLAQKAGRDLNCKNTFIFNFPRSAERISYKCIEAVKDGLLFSPKYESSTLVFNSPHLICFSNSMPDIEQLSLDRWKFYIIKYDNLLPYSIDEYTKEFS